ncbi:precorrin-8X methylmutase [Desulfobacterales bacterium HSG16]|nr:precorrin-8X methylmutase [Desulfobacterales bacterium HSG16]
MTPDEIEGLSFSIIDKEAGQHPFSNEQWQIVRRMIHTSADFEYIKNIRFHDMAVENGLAAIRSGTTIVTDTEMARTGIRKKELADFGCRVECFINDPEVVKKAQLEKSTRAKAAVDAAINLTGAGIYVVGNAPTSLMRLLELVRQGKAAPALVIGLPVGFVNAAESKAMLIETDLPFISNIGRKGGSNLAAAVVNALAIMAVNPV